MSKRISKMLFSKERVELGLEQDINTKLNAMVTEFKQYAKISDERSELGVKYEKAKNQERSMSQKLLSEADSIEKMVDKYKTLAKELGVDVDVNYYEKNIKTLRNEIKFASGGL